MSLVKMARGETMSEEETGQTTQSTMVTRRRDTQGSAEVPMMSYTAVTSHQTMAEAFMKEVVRLGQRMLPDHDLNIEDVLSICHLALKRKERGVVMLEGRHLRGRIGEQVSRADRYKEPFSLLVLNLDGLNDMITYDSVVDTLCERMRKTDLMFLFKYRIVLILPHTENKACEILSHRIQHLLEETVVSKPLPEFARLTYPDENILKTSQVLDWTEDQLRSS